METSTISHNIWSLPLSLFHFYTLFNYWRLLVFLLFVTLAYYLVEYPRWWYDKRWSLGFSFSWCTPNSYVCWQNSQWTFYIFLTAFAFFNTHFVPVQYNQCYQNFGHLASFIQMELSTIKKILGLCGKEKVATVTHTICCILDWIKILDVERIWNEI